MACGLLIHRCLIGRRQTTNQQEPAAVTNHSVTVTAIPPMGTRPRFMPGLS
jgi:hypothetical protein